MTRCSVQALRSSLAMPSHGQVQVFSAKEGAVRSVVAL